MGRGYRSAPRTPSSPLPQRKVADGALPFSPFAAPILYIRAREGAFRSFDGRGTVCPAEGKRKGGGKRTGWWTFSPQGGKACGKQIVDKWKSACFFHRPATNGCKAVDAPRAEDAKTRKRSAKYREVLHEEAKASHQAKEAPPLPTEKNALRHRYSASDREYTASAREKGRSAQETTARKPQNSCAPRTITTRGARRWAL